MGVVGIGIRVLVVISGAHGTQHDRESSVSVVLIPENGVVKIRGTRTGKPDFHLFHQTAMVFHPHSHVKMMATAGHHRLQKSGIMIITYKRNNIYYSLIHKYFLND